MRSFFFVCLVACAPRLTPGFEIEGGDFSNSNIDSVADPAGFEITQVQAVDKVTWIYFDFETKAEVGEDDQSWDLGFSRYKIKMNGGASGPAKVAVAQFKTPSFDDCTQVPAGAVFEQDQPNPKVGEADFVFNRGDGWYYYDLSKHILSARDITYVLRASDGTHYKMHFLAYYDSLGSSGYPAFKWQALRAP